MVSQIMEAIELAQTTTRSVIGTLDLDKIRPHQLKCKVLNSAGESWGIVHRYEIKNISPPKSFDGKTSNSRKRQKSYPGNE